jgi:hypothetical protein
MTWRYNARSHTSAGQQASAFAVLLRYSAFYTMTHYLFPFWRLRMKALFRVGVVATMAMAVVLATPKHAFAQG